VVCHLPNSHPRPRCMRTGLLTCYR
jgi:hypothetical protein